MLTIIPPASPYRYGDPEVLPPEFTASGATGSVHWSTNFGTLSAATGASTVLTPPNETKTITLTAEDDSDTVTSEIEIEATFPVLLNYSNESDVDDTPPEISVPEKGQPRFRESDQITASWPLSFTSRMFDSWVLVRRFLIYHRYSIPFWIEDHSTGELRKGYRDSSVRRKPLRINLWEYSFRFKDYDWQQPEFDADIGPFSPEGALLLGGGGHLLLDGGDDLDLGGEA